MKKMKYLLYRTKKQKFKIQNHLKNESQYVNTMKNEAIKSLQDFQQDCLNKTQLNITLTNTDCPSSNYRSRSEQKENMRRTFINKQPSTKPSNQSKQVLFQSSSLNIRKLLRIKTEVEEKEANKLKNPFYKIQKIRDAPKKFSITDKREQIFQKQDNSFFLKQQKQQTQNKEETFFISRDKKEWYFASRKFRSRTLQHDQNISGNKNIQKSEKKMPQPLPIQKKTEQKEVSSQIKIHERQASDLRKFEDVKILEFNGPKNAQEKQSKEEKQATQIEEASKLRQRSLTVKYNEIKDYFEKKYNKTSTNKEEDGYPMLYFSQKEEQSFPIKQIQSKALL